MKARIKFILRRLKAAANIGFDLLYDGRRFHRWSSSGKHSDLTPEELIGRILAKAHSIEKGLSMPDPRPFFGTAALTELDRRLREFEGLCLDRNHPAYRKGRDVIQVYFKTHADRGLTPPAELGYLQHWLAEPRHTCIGGSLSLRATDVQADARGDFRTASLSRHSIRMFRKDPVAPELVREAVALAQRSPSVCNRQGCRVYVVEDPAKRRKALEIQGGNRGFTEEIQCLLVVVSSLPVFRDSKERNQGWVDGGLFSMSLLLALHHLGLGACPLNWSAGRAKDRQLRTLLGIPDKELVVMLVGAGHLRDEFIVAASPRRPLDEVLQTV